MTILAQFGGLYLPQGSLVLGHNPFLSATGIYTNALVSPVLLRYGITLYFLLINLLEFLTCNLAWILPVLHFTF